MAEEDEEAGEGLLFEFGLRLVRLRKERGWSRDDLAKRLGIQRPRLGNWERGLNSPSFEMLASLGRVLRVSVDELVTGVAPLRKGLSAEASEEAARHLEALCGLLK